MAAINKMVFLLIFIISSETGIAEEDAMERWQNMNISQIDQVFDEMKSDSYEFGEATLFFDRAIQGCNELSQEQCVNAYYGKGRVLNDRDENYKEAIKYFDNALTINSSCCQCLDQKGWALFSSENFDEALAMVDEALEICPSNAHAWNNKGIYYYVHYKDYQKALDFFNKAIEADPRFGDAWYDKYKAHEALYQEDEADAALAKATEYGISAQETGQEG
ncbi:MAG: tetratricopeptide repeat protein [Nitrospirae bacterium]|nr:tetratricopeptide repeat protein [Nitrospirota bacterium]